MQAANLLAVIAPVNQAKGGPGGLLAPADGQAAEVQGQGADATNPFAEALAALMAAPGQAQVQNPATPGTKAEDVATAPQGQQARIHGLQTALAAVTAKGAAANGLVKLTTPLESAAVPAAAPPMGEAGETDQVAGPVSAPTLPETAQAEEALASRLASPPPRAEHAETMAKGPHLPAWAAAPAPTPEAAPIPANPVIAPEVEPVPTPTAVPAAPPPVAAEEAAVAVLAAAQASPKTATENAQRADGKALGKAEAKGAKSALAPGQTVSDPGRGQAVAPGQVKTAQAADVDTDAGPVDTQIEFTAPQAAENDADTPGFLVAEQARAMPTPVHGEGNRLAAHTVAHLASQIVSKSEGKATRFDVQLDPAGLGRVDVKIEISRAGEISAALSFDNPQAAAEMRSRAGELRQALEQAGFDLSKGGLSFDLNSQNPGRQPFDQQPEPPRPSWARGAFTDLAASPEAAPPALRRLIAAGGVDVTI